MWGEVVVLNPFAESGALVIAHAIVKVEVLSFLTEVFSHREDRRNSDASGHQDRATRPGGQRKVIFWLADFN